VARTATTAIELKLAEDAIRDSENNYSRLISNLSEREIRLFDLDPCAERETGA